MKKNLLLFCFLFYTASLSGQDKRKHDSIVGVLLKYQFSDPDKAIHISTSILDTARTTKPFFYLIIGTSYWSKGDKNKSIEFLELSKNSAELEHDDNNYTRAIIALSERYILMGLNDKAKAYQTGGREKVKQIKNLHNRNIRLSNIDSKFAEICTSEKDYECAIKLHNQVISLLQKITITKNEGNEKYTINNNLAVNHLKLAEIYLDLKDLEKAKKNLKFSLIHATAAKDEYTLSFVLAETAILNKLEGNYDKAVSILLPLLDKKNISNDIKAEIHKELAEIYKLKGSIKDENYHNIQYIELTKKDASIEKKAINTSVTNIEKESSAHSSLFKRKAYLIIAVILLIAGIIYIYQHIKISKTKRKYSEILKRLDEIKNSPVLLKQNNKRPINIDKEQEILEKLKTFEKSKDFLSKNMTISLLSTTLETNNTYLSEIINRHYDKNFNTYINELKIYYIIDKIKTENTYRNYKISYLAEECGFISHSSFATTFKNVTGITPSEFISMSKTQDPILNKKTG